MKWSERLGKLDGAEGAELVREQWNLGEWRACGKSVRADTKGAPTAELYMDLFKEVRSRNHGLTIPKPISCRSPVSPIMQPALH